MPDTEESIRPEKSFEALKAMYGDSRASKVFT
jgi:hypothetical protein